jgi:hypothetical protein
MQTLLLLRNALCPSDEPPQPFPEYAVEVLNVDGLDVFNPRITVYYSLLFLDEPAPFIPYLHELTIIHVFNPKIVWKSIHIVVVAVGENLNLFSFLWGSHSGAEVA